MSLKITVNSASESVMEFPTVLVSKQYDQVVLFLSESEGICLSPGKSNNQGGKIYDDYKVAHDSNYWTKCSITLSSL